MRGLVRLKVYLVGGVKVLFRHALSGLQRTVIASSRDEVRSYRE